MAGPNRKRGGRKHGKLRRWTAGAAGQPRAGESQKTCTDKVKQAPGQQVTSNRQANDGRLLNGSQPAATGQYQSPTGQPPQPPITAKAGGPLAEFVEDAIARQADPTAGGLGERTHPHNLRSTLRTVTGLIAAGVVEEAVVKEVIKGSAVLAADAIKRRDSRSYAAVIKAMAVASTATAKLEIDDRNYELNQKKLTLAKRKLRLAEKLGMAKQPARVEINASGGTTVSIYIPANTRDDQPPVQQRGTEKPEITEKPETVEASAIIALPEQV